MDTGQEAVLSLSCSPSLITRSANILLLYISSIKPPQVGLKNMEGADKTPISMEKVVFKISINETISIIKSLQAINIIHDVFISAAEREIHTGDGISLKVLASKNNDTYCTNCQGSLFFPKILFFILAHMRGRSSFLKGPYVVFSKIEVVFL